MNYGSCRIAAQKYAACVILGYGGTKLFSSQVAHTRHISDRGNAGKALSLNTKVLVLNQSYEPISVCNTKKALLLLFLTKADIIEERTAYIVRTMNHNFPFPSVIRLSSYLRVPYKKIELSRKNILRRDSFRCQYCNTPATPLTVDHVIPRSRGGMDQWENLVCACVHCNNKKGSRTPEEANMRLLTTPRKPHHVLFLTHYIGKVEDAWRPYLFMD